MKYPIAISIPHASIFVPKSIQKNLLIGTKDIKNHADLYTDKIYNVKNAHVLQAKIARLILDPNRAPDDIEVECRLQVDGVVVRTTPDGKNIYKHPPDLKSLSKRIEKYHMSYHEALDEMIHDKKCQFLIDGHSMWAKGPSALKDAGINRPQICLGNRDYTTCNREQTYFIKCFFENYGYEVVINKPYAGKFILGFHCNRRHFPGIQIEFRRDLYLNEKTLAPKLKEIKKLNNLIQALVVALSEKFFS